MKLLISLLAIVLLGGCASVKSACHREGGVYVDIEGGGAACILMPRSTLERLQNQDPTK